MTPPVPYKFEVLSIKQGFPSNVRSTAFLRADNWNDWWQFVTMFRLVIFDENGTSHDIGYVKIGQFGMKKDQISPELPPTFESLDHRFFSVGQDDSYYVNLNKLESSEAVLRALNDIAADSELINKALSEPVTKVSLLRDVTETTVRGQFHRITQGGARLSRFRFSYEIPVGANADDAVHLSFKVEPDSSPPSNIHVLIGRNGVGKTHLLNSMTNALVSRHQKTGCFISNDRDSDELFAGLVSVTFSAFDPFPPIASDEEDKTEDIVYAYVGLKRTQVPNPGAPKTPEDLAKEFAGSLKACMRGYKKLRWRRAVKILESDPMFQELDVLSLADYDYQARTSRVRARIKATELFGKLSSGHKIVLLTMTRLVELVEERTLVLIDEPEAHLHPPLLSAFIRTLSDLLTYRNGVAILATHSPVVLQEVPRDCTWILRRAGQELRVERPEEETFGENVGVLTREVFGLEVTQSGFHRLLKEAVTGKADFEDVLDRFKGKLGAEARAIVRGLIAARDADPEV